MLNVNKLTSMLAKLPDQQLQQYAQMHKNDPYIMALAMSESSRRKEVRAAGQTAPEQPKVVDQAVAEMAPQRLPEEQGIGQIPAGNMNFAEGGIIAFADGGDVERYGDLGFTGWSYGDWASADRKRRQQLLEEERAKNMAIANAEGAYAGRGLGILSDPQVGAPEAVLEGIPYDPATATRRSAYEKPGASVAAPKADAAPALSPTMQAPRVGGLDVAAMTKKALDAAATQPNPFASDVEAIGKEKVAAKEAEVTGLEAIHKQFSDIYKGRKERLDKKEGDIEKMKDQSLGLALLQAGASMMSTRGGIGMAIGKGVEVGTQQYAAGLDKVRSAQEKLSDARDRLEEIEAQRGEMSARELNKARNEVKTAGIGAREDLLKANMQMYGVNRETAMKMVDNQVKVGIAQLEQSGRAAAANRNPQLELIQAIQKDPSLAATYQAMHGTKNDLMSQYTDYLGKNPTGSIEDFLKTKALFSTLSGVTAAKPVSALPPGASVLGR